MQYLDFERNNKKLVITDSDVMKNDGICHFSVVSDNYKFASTVCYDVFHVRGKIGKNDSYICKTLDENYEILEHF